MYTLTYKKPESSTKSTNTAPAQNPTTEPRTETPQQVTQGSEQAAGEPVIAPSPGGDPTNGNPAAGRAVSRTLAAGRVVRRTSAGGKPPLGTPAEEGKPKSDAPAGGGSDPGTRPTEGKEETGEKGPGPIARIKKKLVRQFSKRTKQSSETAPQKPEVPQTPKRPQGEPPKPPPPVAEPSPAPAAPKASEPGEWMTFAEMLTAEPNEKVLFRKATDNPGYIYVWKASDPYWSKKGFECRPPNNKNLKPGQGFFVHEQDPGKYVRHIPKTAEVPREIQVDQIPAVGAVKSASSLALSDSPKIDQPKPAARVEKPAP